MKDYTQSCITFLVALVFFASLSTSAQNPGFRRQTVIDTAAAVGMMKEHIDRLNRPTVDRIAWLKDSTSQLMAEKQVFADSLSSVVDLLDHFAVKIKDKDRAATYLAYFTAVFDRLPEKDILAMAKEKDVEKALRNKNPESAVAELTARVREKALKRISKGELDAPFIHDTLVGRHNRYCGAIALINGRIGENREEIGRCEASVVKVPSFDYRKFTEITGETDCPNRQIRTAVSDPNYRSYEQLAAQFPAAAFKSVGGRFNGVIADRVAVFPYGEGTPGKSDLTWEEGVFYKRAVVKSENGTMADLILEPIFDDRFFYSENYGVADLGLMLLMETWGAGESPKDGLELIFSCLGDAESYTIAEENAKWVKKEPLNAMYLSYSKSRKLWDDVLKERGLAREAEKFSYKVEYCDDYKGETEILWFPVFYRDIQFKTVFKSPDLPDLVVPAVGLKGFYVAENAFGQRNDGLAVVYEGTASTGGSYVELYKISQSDYGGISILNGNDTHECLYWELVYTSANDPETGDGRWVKLIGDIDGNIGNIAMPDEVKRYVVADKEGREQKLTLIHLWDEGYDAYLGGRYVGRVSPQWKKRLSLSWGEKGRNVRSDVPKSLLPSFEVLKGSLLGDGDVVEYYSGSCGEDIELWLVQNGENARVRFDIAGESYTGKAAPMMSMAECFRDEDASVCSNELPPFVGEGSGSACNLVLTASQAAGLLKGVVFGRDAAVRSAEIIAVSRLGKNWMVEFDVNDGSLYDAIYTPEGKLLDAVYLGFVPSDGEASDDGDDMMPREYSRVKRTGPREISLVVFRSVKDNYGWNTYHHQFRYKMTDEAFLLERCEWNFPESANPYKWAYIDPFGFLCRFPASCTPWPLLDKLGSRVDGENAEGFWEDSMCSLYRRNPAAFFERALADHRYGREAESAVLRFLTCDSEHVLEPGELQRDLDALPNRTTALRVMRCLQSEVEK